MNKKIFKIAFFMPVPLVVPLVANGCNSNKKPGPKPINYSIKQILSKFSFETLKGTSVVNYLDPDYTADKTFITNTLKLEPDKTFNSLKDFTDYAQPALDKAKDYSFSDLTQLSKTKQLGAVKSQYRWFANRLKLNNINLATKTIFNESDLASVTQIDYRGQNFSNQEFPDNVGALQGLTKVVLRSDKLTGQLPPSLYLDQGITELTLFDNSFNGTLPASYGYLTNVTRINFCVNYFTGPIPESYADNTTYPSNKALDLTKGSLKNIRTFLFEGNYLSGNIPSNMGTIQSVTRLGLFDNRLTGNIPSTFDKLTNLNTGNADFSVTNNNLSGSNSKRFPARGWPGWGRQSSSSENYLNALQNTNLEKQQLN